MAMAAGSGIICRTPVLFSTGKLTHRGRTPKISPPIQLGLLRRGRNRRDPGGIAASGPSPSGSPRPPGCGTGPIDTNRSGGRPAGNDPRRTKSSRPTCPAGPRRVSRLPGHPQAPTSIPRQCPAPRDNPISRAAPRTMPWVPEKIRPVVRQRLVADGTLNRSQFGRMSSRLES